MLVRYPLPNNLETNLIIFCKADTSFFIRRSISVTYENRYFSLKTTDWDFSSHSSGNNLYSVAIQDRPHAFMQYINHCSGTPETDE